MLVNNDNTKFPLITIITDEVIIDASTKETRYECWKSTPWKVDLYVHAIINPQINENKSGVFVNMTFLEPTILEKIEEYLNYMKEQEENLITTEYQKQEFINSYFVEKEDKDNMPITYSIAK